VAIAMLSLALAALLGFSIHRGSVCMVRGVAELLSTGRAYMLLSFGKAVLWVLIVTTPVLWLVPAPGTLDHSWALSGSALAGGFLFGVGAAVNRGCAFSTLGRLGNGELGAMLTLGGFAVGAWSYLSMVTWWSLAGPEPLPATYDPLDPRTGVLVAALGAWGVWEIVRLWRARPAGASWIELVFARSYRLSAAVALIGAANGILYALHGPWTYTRTVNETIMAPIGGDLGPLAFQWVLFVAVVAGVVASAWQKGTFRLDWRPSRSWAQDFAGGLLMGIGAGMTPGGNDVLVLHSIPQLSAHALPAYLTMTAGIAVVLIGMRALSSAHLEVDCRGDVCRTRRIQASRAPWASHHSPRRMQSQQS
jgi:hypothetical protein